MDIEETARRVLCRGGTPEEAGEVLTRHILEYKAVSPAYAREFAQAVVTEVENTMKLTGDLFTFPPSGVAMGEFGVGSRGSGDFFAHRQIARVIGTSGAAVGVEEMDDAGAVQLPGGPAPYLVCTVDGMHSRLSDFPFLAGFHVTRATLRDLAVMGSTPLLLFSDIHVADDGDVAKIFEYTAGITTVGEALGVPLVSGSTLRIGGDMVIGSRMTGCVGSVGIANHLTPRRAMAPGDRVLMTAGAGGGTIATAAIYSGYPDVVERTINLHFLRACKALRESGALPLVHAMTDVTNGGLRGDTHEMAQTAGCRIVITEEAVRPLVDPVVLSMLDNLRIDVLGVSIDALLLTVPPAAVDRVSSVIRGAGVPVSEIGRVEAGAPEALLERDGRPEPFVPRFRESAYTPVKKVADREPRDRAAMERAVAAAADAAIAKKKRTLLRLMQAPAS